MSLDTRGKIAAAQLAFYAPIAGISSYLVVRYALRRDAGWLFLSLFSMARMAGGALVLAGQLQPNFDALTAAYVLEPSALSLLLLSTLGFLGMAGQHTYSEIPRVTVIFRSFGGITLIGLGLAIAGGILGSPVSPDDADIGTTLRRVSSCVYAGVWVLLVLAFFGTFSYRWHLRSYRRNLLWGIGIGMPFLGTRIAYGIMAAWSSSNLYGTVVPVNRTLSKMNPVTGDWVMYLVLGLVMEFAAAAMYLFASTVMARRYY
ncbi:hypothetical protein CC1G_01681 [Coprinopsis cinerea okayama7|uniref:DUF7702 domain-containing protein n=1 Tax=Coprinopsis cinerea (strain Okayama-7 / 130 / ATCC MYA-4618 / FGSC 9003) TaxID=240176 RepID=A8N2I1_COPC7|nr:hypothetical protein CC1G_01681 [Coprinopsis cinerea okayama7\|eukprot:XP_001829001.1 hypothetical protein CC1G_01681 [Coprinopsis cinerea okayama7\